MIAWLVTKLGISQLAVEAIFVGIIFLAAFTCGWTVESWHRDSTDKDLVSKQQEADKQACNNSNQPSIESDSYDKNKTNALLAACNSQLLQHPTCVPVLTSNTTSGSKNASKQQPGGVTLSAINAANSDCQLDRNDLNTLRLFYQACKKNGTCQ